MFIYNMETCFSFCECLNCLANIKNVFNNLLNCTCLEKSKKHDEPREEIYKITFRGHTVIGFEKITL